MKELGHKDDCGMGIILLWGIQGMLDEHPEWTESERTQFIRTCFGNVRGERGNLDGVHEQ